MFSDVLLKHICEVKRASFTISASRLVALIANLIFLHDVIVASEQLLIEAVASTDLLPRNSFHARLVQYYCSLLEEERDHVKWMREDLKSVGVNVLAALPNQLAMGMAGSQYYLLKHAHPAALLGYMAVLEGDPTPVEAIEALEHQYGKQLLRTARIHAVKDLEHRKELFEVIDDAPGSLRGLISYSTDNTLEYMIAAARIWVKKERYDG
jgi:hypothetical protein